MSDTHASHLLADLVQRTPHTRGALLLSAAGLVRAAHGLDTDAADHLAALASSLYALARRAGIYLDGGGRARQVVVELDTALLFVTAAGPGTCLAVLADRETDAAALGHAMAALTTRLQPEVPWSFRTGTCVGLNVPERGNTCHPDTPSSSRMRPSAW